MMDNFLLILFLVLLLVAFSEWPRFFMAHWFMREPEFLWTGTGEPAGAVPLADWRRVLEVPLEEKRLAVIKRAYRRKAQVAHPDRGGDTAAMTQLNEAYRLALEELGGN
ncbi:J domain-containing protein [Ferrovum sp.]|uniref:J domain-containing protein n=1 Tax=Ferrovum sp. TaxID=2609467 RepID=UPI002629CF94|nr:J domain-containing protein [Ferrovum sp.]